MSKRKDKSSNQTQAHPQKTFSEYVADATLAKLGGYINSQIQEVGRAVAQRQAQSIANLMTRVIATEEILMEMNPAITKESLANRVAAIQDRGEGYEAVPAGEATQKGDRVRVELKTRTADQAEFQGSSRLQIDNIGLGNTLGLELEGAIVGMIAGEVKEVTFGKDNSLVASISLNRLSRAPKEETKEEAVEAAPAEEAPSAETAPVAQPATEAPNASANAG